MIAVDFHSHTFMSQCGIHTHVEMLTAARERGLAGLAITDHGPALGGRHPNTIYERMTQPVPGIRFLKGIEANVTDEDGAIDVPGGLLKYMDIVLLGLHLKFERKPGSRDWTDSLVNAIERNPYVDIITHPVDDQFPIDIERLASAAKANGTALELNNSKILFKRTPVEPVIRFLEICRDIGCMVVVSSDAHTLLEVGDDTAVRPLLDAVGIPDIRVVNASAESAFRFVDARRARRLAWIAANT